MSDLSICISFDFDAMSNWIGSFKSRNAAQLSRGEFGAFAIDRILRLLDAYDIRATFFTPGHTILAFPEVVGEISARGHELGHHGWVHENPLDLSADEERRVLERAFEAFETVVGVRPVGYRSPGAAFSDNTVNLLVEYEFLYDSSCSARDFSPYYLRNRDVWSLTDPYVFGDTVELVEIPYAWVLNDFHVFEFAPPLTTNQYAPSVVKEIWMSEFDFAYESCRPGVYTLTLHPQTIGRGHRLKVLQEFLGNIAARDAVKFETMSSIAQRWKEQNALEEWASKALHGSSRAAR
jgi:peptidoglycan/xylan/chitin deacetylase (PgdA/CDA1 family)